jgi:uncharacterized membrane protein
VIAPLSRHVTHHGRFYAAAALGLAVGLLARGEPALRLLFGGDVFFLAYLALTVFHTARSTPEEMRRRAAYEDEGGFVIILMALVASALSLGAIFTLVNRDEMGGLHLALAVASIPLGWVTLHTVMAFHYAHLYYARQGKGTKGRDAGGLGFPETREPHAWDFVYFSFVIGTTCQVSDVPVLSTGLRRLVLAHSVVSFFFNTTVIALAVNVVASQAR